MVAITASSGPRQAREGGAHGERLELVGEHVLAQRGRRLLVLARSEAGTRDGRGLSLFVCHGDATVKVRRIEHKLGIHASPTAVMAYEDATGYLVGEANRGLEYMFVMMNSARYAVGLQGIAVAERATQLARQYALEMVNVLLRVDQRLNEEKQKLSALDFDDLEAETWVTATEKPNKISTDWGVV